MTVEARNQSQSHFDIYSLDETGKELQNAALNLDHRAVQGLLTHLDTIVWIKDQRTEGIKQITDAEKAIYKTFLKADIVYNRSRYAEELSKFDKIAKDLCKSKYEYEKSNEDKKSKQYLQNLDEIMFKKNAALLELAALSLNIEKTESRSRSFALRTPGSDIAKVWKIKRIIKKMHEQFPIIDENVEAVLHYLSQIQKIVSLPL